MLVINIITFIATKNAFHFERYFTVIVEMLAVKDFQIVIMF